MKAYPSIPHSTGQSFREFEAYVFDKLDGSNLRWEWRRKAGWCKFGTRHRLFDETDEVFGMAIALFMEKLAEPLERVARDQRWQQCTVFTEFWGVESFAGLHEPEDPKFLTLLDVDVYKQGLIDPREFLKLYEGLVETPRYFGRIKWTRGFVAEIRQDPQEAMNEYANHPGYYHDSPAPAPTFEGVVGKAMSGRKRIMAKAKTQAWINRVQERYSAEEAAKIIAS